MAEQSLATAALGALQACVSVLLTMAYGVAARRLRLVHETTINDMIGMGVKLFLPALILTKLGQELHGDIAVNCLLVVAWTFLFVFASVVIGYAIIKLLRLPLWVITACAFNNTTSLPLLLLESLESVGSVRLIVREKDSVPAAIDRAQSYFLVCAVVSKCLAYTLGSRVLQSGRGEVEGEEQQRQEQVAGRAPEHCAEEEGESGHRQPTQEEVDERTSLIPEHAQRFRDRVKTHLIKSRPSRWLQRLASCFPPGMRREMMAPFESGFADLAVLCAILGTVVGLVPTLHRWFFNEPYHGGIFSGWLTSSIKNIGGLFTSIQIFFVGCKLGVSFERMKVAGTTGQRISIRALVTLFAFRLVVWPALSISIIYYLALKTTVFREDPILWFSMMLMPAGPPALVLSGLAELAQMTELEKMAIARTMTIMYALSPFICFTITGALKASQAAMKARNLPL